MYVIAIVCVYVIMHISVHVSMCVFVRAVSGRALFCKPVRAIACVYMCTCVYVYVHVYAYQNFYM